MTIISLYSEGSIYCSSFYFISVDCNFSFWISLSLCFAIFHIFEIRCFLFCSFPISLRSIIIFWSLPNYAYFSIITVIIYLGLPVPYNHLLVCHGNFLFHLIWLFLQSKIMLMFVYFAHFLSRAFTFLYNVIFVSSVNYVT